MAYVTGYTYTVLTNQSATIAYVTGYTYAVLTNQSATIVYVTGCVRTRFNQSEHGYSVRHAAYVTVYTYAVQPIIISHTN